MWPEVHAKLLHVAKLIEDPFTFKHAPPVMAWELELSSTFSLQQEVLRYTLCLFASVLVGAGISGLRSPSGQFWDPWLGLERRPRNLHLHKYLPMLTPPAKLAFS